jgi:hypothetical protein
MAFSGINFRATAGYVTDGSGETYSLGEAYPVTRGGLTFGWASNQTSNTRDRNSGIDRRLAGIVFQPNSAAATTFRLNLPSGAGTYRVRLALGDDGAAQDIRAIVRNGTGGSALATVNGSTLFVGEWFDAAGTRHESAAGWVANNATVELVFSADHLILELGGHSSGDKSSVVCHLAVELVSGGAATAITLTGPSSGTVGSPSTNFTVGANGTITGTITVTPSDGGDGGSFSPTSLAISSGTPTATFTYAAANAGSPTATINVTNSGGLSNPAGIAYSATVPAATSMTIALKQSGGTTAAAGITGIRGVILNASTLDACTAVLDNFSGESTDASGNLVLDITGLGLAVGDVRQIATNKSDGTVGADFDGWVGPGVAA